MENKDNEDLEAIDINSDENLKFETNDPEENEKDLTEPNSSFYWLNMEKTLMSYQKCGQFCDVALISATREFKVHGIMLAGASEILAAILTNSSEIESETWSLQRLTFPQISDETMECFVKYVYTGCLELPSYCRHKKQLDETLDSLQQLGVNFEIISEFKVLDGRLKCNRKCRNKRRNEENGSGEVVDERGLVVEDEAVNLSADVNSNQCLECGRTFKQKCNLIRHQQCRHSATNRYTQLCEVCGANFLRCQDLAKHVTETHDGNKSSWKRPKFVVGSDENIAELNSEAKTCPFCQMTFSDRAFLYHIDSHGPLPEEFAHLASNVVCHICKRGFATQHFMKKHLQAEHSEEVAMFTCYHCGKSFFSMDKLNVHMSDRHITPKQNGFHCETCKKDFLTKTLLHQHSMLHSGNRPYVCSICGKGFISKTYFQQVHMRAHTGQKDYQCKICYKSFLQIPHLKRHLLHHTGERPHKCRDCVAEYKNRSDLKSHYLKVHNCQMPVDLKASKVIPLPL